MVRRTTFVHYYIFVHYMLYHKVIINAMMSPHCLQNENSKPMFFLSMALRVLVIAVYDFSMVKKFSS